MELFSLRKIHRICPWHCGPGPPAPAHGSMNLIKRRPLATRSTAQIKQIELVSRLLISAVHHRSDGWDGWLRPTHARAHACSGTSGPSTAAHQSLSFLKLRWSVSMRFAPTGSQRQGKHVYANLNRRRAATEPDNSEAARLVLVDGEGGLQWSFGSKHVRQGFFELPSSFSTD
jgi:hypothetical protein